MYGYEALYIEDSLYKEIKLLFKMFCYLLANISENFNKMRVKGTFLSSKYNIY